MEIRKSLLGMIKAYAGGWDAMAPALGMTRDALENRIYERKGQGVLIETALQMQKFSNTTFFAEAVATASGGTFMALPESEAIDKDVLLSKFNELYAVLGTLSGEFAQATKDDEIDERERLALEAVAAKMHKTIKELMGLMFHIYCRKSGSATLAGMSRDAA